MENEVYVTIGAISTRIPIREAVQMLIDFSGVRYVPPSVSRGYFTKLPVGTINYSEEKKDESSRQDGNE